MEDISQELTKIKRFLQEAKKYLDENDIVQSSEKLYKVVEDGIKLLARERGIKEYKIVMKSKRWLIDLLESASYTLSSLLRNRIIKDAWLAAYNLHVFGFHEERLESQIIRGNLILIEKFVKFMERELKRKSKNA